MVEEEVVKLGISNIRLRNNQQAIQNTPSRPANKSGFWIFSKN